MHKTLVATLLVGMLGTAHADDEPQAPAAQHADDEWPTLAPRLSYTPAAPAPEPAPRDRSDETAAVDETPPLSGGRLVGEALVGGLFAGGGGIGGAFLGAGLELAGGCHSEFCGLGGAIIGGVVGVTFVTPVGVYLVGSADGQTGSLGATIGGSALGALLGIAAVAGSGEAALPALVIAPLVGSMIGFNATRSYDRPHRKHKVIPVASVANGNTSFGVAGLF